MTTWLHNILIHLQSCHVACLGNGNKKFLRLPSSGCYIREYKSLSLYYKWYIYINKLMFPDNNEMGWSWQWYKSWLSLNYSKWWRTRSYWLTWSFNHQVWWSIKSVFIELEDVLLKPYKLTDIRKNKTIK